MINKTDCVMKKFLTLFLLLTIATQAWSYDFLRPVKGQIKNGYDFWVYTPQDYFYTLEKTPVIIFLHGASLCGHNLNRVRRYGPLDAIVKGREIDAITIVPQNTGGAWNPKKVMQVLDWVKANYACDTTRVYVLGMSLGGYGTMDVCDTYPDRIAAGMALCGGCSYSDVANLGKLPFWIIHGTADRAVSISQSKRVVNNLKASGNDSRLRYDWLPGADHGAPARIFYLKKTYDWLFSHSLVDKDRPLNRDVSIDNGDLRHAYKDIVSGTPNPEIINGLSITTGNEY
jgi:predicted peptidase